MRYSVRRPLLSAAAVLLAGAMAFAQPVLRAGADFQIFQYQTPVTRTHPIGGTVTRIEIEETSADVNIVYDIRSAPRVVCDEFPTRPHTVTVTDGVLKVSAYDPGVSISLFSATKGDPEVTIYLPDTTYESLTFASSSGDLETSSKLTFGSVSAESVSGDLEISSTVTGSLQAETTSGDVEIKSPQAGSLRAVTVSGDIEVDRVTASGPMELNTTSGEVDVSDSEAAALTLSAASGKVELERVTITGDASVTTTSGRIEMTQFRVQGTPTIETRTGRIRGWPMK
ncbi:MAG: DUF4097 domain-containing protein [Candidatus Faecalibacterium intestinavium]|uniref:DUF4097 domain-containing protein n=1 Tax=Candidatus Faecalibacterium intestinavium TaxID=2838580 RepID=A0A9E2KM58_9FIRM|nr:DUF4097 domain-containing protein [Candidatus Faecalibacterium intestinavium]